MELILIEIDSLEWQYMWEWLANHPINKDNEDPKLCHNDGEGWQYMGSYRNGKRVIHEFRHRNHPITKRVERLSVNASEGLTDDQVNKSFKI